jgi:ABC-2 type transport system ATP-binding protein
MTLKDSPQRSHPPAVQVHDLTLRYGRTTALDRLSLTLDGGKIYGLIGRNGSGKTSLLSVLAAFRRASGGEVLIGGEHPYENERITRQICLIRESGDVLDYRVHRVLDFARRLRPAWDQEYAQRLVDRFRLPLRKRPQQLSRGQRSALGCILGLASRAPLTMFDEAYLGMDAPSRYAFYEELVTDYAAHPRTIILSTHLIEEFGSLFEEVVMIDQGGLVLHEETDALRTRGAAVTGPAELVDTFVAGAIGMTVLGERRLGGTKAVTVYGSLSEQLRRRADTAGLQLEPVALQDLFVHLTAGAGAA